MRDERMDGLELKARREYLGLTLDAAALLLGVRQDTLRRWESGREPIPYRVPDELGTAERFTKGVVEDIITTLEGSPTPIVHVYSTDELLLAGAAGRWSGECPWVTARWWRHAATRAAAQVPGVRLIRHD